MESTSIDQEQPPHPNPFAVSDPLPVDLAANNRSCLQSTYNHSRDAIQAVLNQFTADHASISHGLTEQSRLLADANEAKMHAERDLVEEKETVDSLKRKLRIIETCNSELSSANRKYKDQLTDIQAENIRTNKANKSALGQMRDAKAVAEELQDAAANKRKQAIEDRDKARSETEGFKKSAKTAEAVVRRAIQEKEDAVCEAGDLKGQVESLTAKLQAYEIASRSHAQDPPGEPEATVRPDDAAQLAQQQAFTKELGLAPPGSS